MATFSSIFDCFVVLLTYDLLQRDQSSVGYLLLHLLVVVSS